MKYPHPKSNESGFRPGTLVLVLSVVLLLSACHKNIGTPEAVRSNDPEKLKLKDYRPESIYHVPVTMVNKAAFGVIDMYSHSYAGSRDETS
ncbi:MAG TPA: hypothetical protein VE870_05970 [Bacteroidales bacterium]|nr:hypothetical protein [Bacteroidales bacterium]